MRGLALTEDIEQEIGGEMVEARDDNDNFEVEVGDSEQSRKRRRLVKEVDPCQSTSLPEGWRHVRHSIGKVDIIHVCLFSPSF